MHVSWSMIIISVTMLGHFQSQAGIGTHWNKNAAHCMERYDMHTGNASEAVVVRSSHDQLLLDGYKLC